MPATAPVPVDDRFVVLVPVKPPAVAKSRLADLGHDARRRLAIAFAVDTVTAALRCPSVERVMVVTDDHVLAGDLGLLGVDTLPDGASDDLNGTLRLAAAEMHRRHPTLRLAALCADLPALRPDELGLVLAAADPDRMTFVADQERVGTTVVVASSLDRFRPEFGPESRLRHLAAGASEVDGIDVPSVRRDVDDRAALVDALRLGVGPRTSLVVNALDPRVS
jgi:2-phospho-L-lactate guanylyltransferase